MIYAGSSEYKDYPANFGLAYSNDLINWTKYADNPIFHRGEKGNWDEGGIWFGTINKINNLYYMWYEGFGGGISRENEYGQGGKSQIGLAIYEGTFFTDIIII